MGRGPLTKNLVMPNEAEKRLRSNVKTDNGISALESPLTSLG